MADLGAGTGEEMPLQVCLNTKEAAIMEVMKRLAEWYPDDGDMERRIQAVVRQLPAVLSIRKVTDVEQLLASFYPEWDKTHTHNVATLVYTQQRM